MENISTPILALNERNAQRYQSVVFDHCFSIVIECKSAKVLLKCRFKGVGLGWNLRLCISHRPPAGTGSGGARPHTLRSKGLEKRHLSGF